MENNSIEMLVHTALTAHKEPEAVLIITDNRESIQRELDRYKFLKLDLTISSTADILETLQNTTENSLDVVIIDGEIGNSLTIFAHSNRALKRDGLISTRGDFATLKVLASEFRIAMPYLVNSLEEKSTTLLFGSKFYHPTADINLQRADFIEGCNYYSSDIQYSAFIMPNFIKSKIKEFVKN